MTWQSWTWIAMAVAFCVVEGIAIKQKDRPGKPRTFSANIWWLVKGTGPWHQMARALLVFGLGLLSPHLLG